MAPEGNGAMEDPRVLPEAMGRERSLDPPVLLEGHGAKERGLDPPILPEVQEGARGCRSPAPPSPPARGLRAPPPLVYLRCSGLELSTPLK